MTRRLGAALLASVAFAVTTLASSCTDSVGAAPPVICGTRVDPDITHRLIDPGSFHEQNRVNRSEATSAPCTLLSGQDPVIRFHYWWADGQVDLKYMAEQTGGVSRIANVRKIDLPYDTLVGNDGALAATPCISKAGDHFALTIQFPKINLTDQSHRADIEKFMRAYFPATVKTLGCA